MMANNNHIDTRYQLRKCSGSMKYTPVPTWLLCVLIHCIIALPCALSACMGVNIGVATYPEGVIYVRYGDPLEIFCVAENSSSDNLEFLSDGEHVESERINDTTRRLYIKNPEKQFNIYYCKNNNSKRSCFNRVLVESPPADVTDFNCISKNFDVFNCSWTNPFTFSVIKNNLTFAVNGKIVGPPCVAQRAPGTQTYYCVWRTTSTPRYRQQEKTQYMYLTSENIFGCHHQNFTIDHYSIVKPDPPQNLNVVKVGPHSVVLKWEIPYNMVDLLPCGLEHIIEYQIAKIDNTTYFHRVDASSLRSKTASYKFQLNNLPYAYMQYEVRIYIKSKDAVKRDFWSDFSYTVFYTASERPQRPPDMISGAFDQAIWEEKRIVYVYWTPLEDYEKAGANLTYKVLLRQGNKTFPIMYPDKNKSYVLLRMVPLAALDVTVWAVNDNGSSSNSSHLHIPAEEETHSLRLISFTRLSYENGTYELSWDGITNIDNYTLFWCNETIFRICSGRMDFAVFDPKQTTHVIDLGNEYRYQFAISVNNGTNTSGMLWATNTFMDRFRM